MPGANKLYMGANRATKSGLGPNLVAAPNGPYGGNAPWTLDIAGNVNDTGTATDPLGGTTARAVNDGTNNNNHRNYLGTSSISATWLYTLYYKHGTDPGIYFGENSGVFNVLVSTAGVVTPTAGVTATSTNLGSGWFKLTAQWTGVANFFVWGFGTSFQQSYLGTSATANIWGASQQQVI